MQVDLHNTHTYTYLQAKKKMLKDYQSARCSDVAPRGSTDSSAGKAALMPIRMIAKIRLSLFANSSPPRMHCSTRSIFGKSSYDLVIRYKQTPSDQSKDDADKHAIRDQSKDDTAYQLFELLHVRPFCQKLPKRVMSCESANRRTSEPINEK